MNLLLAFRNVAYRPWRSLLLLAGYGIGVAVMIVLLAIGEALVVQSRDERLVGGGDVTVLPEGINIEVMKTGGLGGMFFSIDNARFIHLQLLGSTRLASVVQQVAPQIDNKLVYLRAGATEFAVRASGEIPSASAAVGAVPELLSGSWDDDAIDARWLSPNAQELRHSIDHFHLPPSDVEDVSSWGEWHYFNVISDDGLRWAFVSLIIGGDVPDGEWGGQVLITTHEQGGAVRRFATEVRSEDIEFSTARADLRIGSSSVTVLENGDYQVRAVARERATGAEVSVNLTLVPADGAYFPGASIGGNDFTSGYAVAALRADATGEICVQGRCDVYTGAQGYHDHNWGVWRGVTWEWGAARVGSYALLYGRVEPPDADTEGRPLFLYLVDSLGYRGIMRPAQIVYEGERGMMVDGALVQVPLRGVMQDVRGGDTLRVEIEIEDVSVTDMRKSLVERGDVLGSRSLARPYFLQMKGTARISGTVGGATVAGSGRGFFETYR